MTTQGQSLLNQLSSIERCANMGANCCAETKAAIARLEAKIDGIPRVDPAQIIKDAVKAVFAHPEWTFVLGAIGFLKSDNASINSQLRKHGGLIRENTQRASSAINKADKLENLVKFLTTDVADLFGKFGKIANSIASILGIVGSLAGLASLAGTIGVVFPRLDAHDRELDALRQAASDAISLAGKGITASREAQARADKAQQQANDAANDANRAIREANSASAEANRATREANEATDKANKATKTSNDATGTADLARRTADNATATADLARRDATNANDRASSAETKVKKLDGDFRPLEQEFWQNIKPGVFVALTGLQGLINRLDKLYLDVYPTAGSLLPRINGLESDVARLKTTPNQASSGVDQVARDEAARANRAAQSAAAAAGASATTAGVALTTSSTAVTIAQQALNRPVPSQNLSFDPKAVRPVAIEAAKAEFDRRVKEDFTFDPTVVKPVSIPEAQKLINETIQRDFKFDPAIVQPVAVAAARAEVQQRFDQIRQDNQNQLGQLGDRITQTAQNLGQQISNLIISPATASESNVAQLEKTLQQTPTVKNLQQEITGIKTQQTNEARVNQEAIVKLDQINTKLDRPTTVTLDPETKGKITKIEKTTDLNTIILNSINTAVDNVKKGITNIVDQINRAINQINTLSFNINAFISQLNTFINKLNAFVVNVNKMLRSILNEVIWIVAALTILRPVILLMSARVLTILTKLGKLINWLVIDRILNVINFVANLHNALMLSNQLKVTLLEMLASVGNATGLLQTSDGDNIDLNQVFTKGVEQLIVLVVGEENYTGLKLAWRKYNRIYQAATNSLNAITGMFNSIGNVIEVASEYTGRIGNALRAASVVRERAYNYMSENFNVRTSKFMRFQTTIGTTTEILETINEIAENVVEGQQAYTEAVKATADFQKELREAEKKPGIDNAAIKAEAEKIKQNLVQDPTGEKDSGYFSFLTD